MECFNFVTIASHIGFGCLRANLCSDISIFETSKQCSEPQGLPSVIIIGFLKKISGVI